MIKIYETINDARLVTTVEVKGENRVVTFAGGALCPEWRAAVFQSDDEKIQTALEASSSFGISYRLKTTVEQKEIPIALINADEVFNKQSAIEWLRIKFGLRYPTSTAIRTLEQAAAEKGYTFLNWTKNE